MQCLHKPEKFPPALSGQSWVSTTWVASAASVELVKTSAAGSAGVASAACFACAAAVSLAGQAAV